MTASFLCDVISFVAFILTLVDGNFTQWEIWSGCSVTCGKGVQRRFRSCTKPPPSNGGQDCIGDRLETRECVKPPCPGDTTS